MNLNFYSKAILTLTSLRKSLVLCILAVVLSVNNSQAQGASALAFDGVDDYVTIPVKSVLNVSSYLTIEAWIKPTSAYGVQDVLSKSSSTSNNGYIFPRTSTGWGNIEFLINLSGYGWKTLRVPYGTAKRNQWHHVAATYDGYTMSIYIDAVLAGTFSFAGSITVNNNSLTLGNQPGYEENYGGHVDDVRVFNRPLSQCEISSSMNCELSGNENGLVAYYKFNQGLLGLPNPLVTTVTDSSPTGANGTLVNFGLLGTGVLSNWSAGTVTVGNSCPAFVPTTVTAGSLNSLVAIGGTINLTAQSVDGATYSWSGPNGFTSDLQNPTIVGVPLSASGTYTVTATFNGCAGTASTIVTVAPMASGLNFDGSNDYVTAPHSASMMSSTLSVEAWIYPTSANTFVQNVIGKSTYSSRTGYKFPKTDDKWANFSFELSIDNQFQALTAAFPTSALNQWNHVAATFDGFYMRIYLNGVLAGTKEVNGTFTPSNSPLIIGNGEGRVEYFKGTVDEVRIWNRALSQCEIINNMKTCELNGDNNGLANQVGLAAYYRFNQGLINVNNAPYTTLADSSGHNNHGTLFNFDLNGPASNWVDGKVYGICDYFPLPTLTASANGSTFQTGSTAKLFAANGNNNIYSWAGPNSFSTTTQNPVLTNVQQSAAGIYTVTTPYVNCVVNASTRIKVSDVAPIVAAGPTAICPSGSVALSIATPGTSYQWFLNDVAINGATTNAYTATQGGIYTVNITNGSEVIVSSGLEVTIIADVTAPVPNVATLPVINIVSPATVTTIPTATDNCKGQVNGTSNIPLTFTHSGTYVITWSYNDGNGNTSTQTQTVVVEQGVDATPPVLTVPANINTVTSSNACGAVVNFAATATDETDNSVTITYSQNPGTVFATGTTTVTVTASDDNNNTTTGTFTVTVVDATAPVLTVPANITSGTGTGINIGTATATDNCGTATVTHSAVPATFPVGTTTITWTATDAAGNTTVKTQTVTVADVTPPTLVGVPANTTANCGVLPAVPTVTAVDNNDPNPTVTYASVTNGNTVTRTWTATDANGNTSSQSQIITVIPVPAAPVVTVVNNCGSSTLTASNYTGTLLWSNNATSASINVSTGGTYTVTQTVNGCTSAAGSAVAAPKATPAAPTVTVVDNCGSSTLTASNYTGTLLWSNNATSASVNVSTGGTYTVTQTVNGCTSAAGSAVAAPKAAPTAPTVTVTNNCGSTILTASNYTGTLAWTGSTSTSSSIVVTSAGTYSVTQTVNGCTSAATAKTVTVNTNPVVSNITGSTSVNAGSSTQLSNATPGGVWSSNSANATVNTSGLVTGVSAGTATITYTVTVNGCSTAVTTQVTVTAVPTCIAPVFTSNVSNINLNATAQCNAAATYTATVSGTTPAITYTFSGATTGSGTGTGSGATFAIGTTTVTIKAANNCGTVTTSFTVVVKDVTAPVAATKNITVALNANGQATIAPSDVNNGSYDNCGDVTLAFKAAGTTTSTTTGTVYATADENGTLVLTAPSNATITAINFASYGTPNGSNGNFTVNSACNATTSKSVVEGYALGKNSVSIPATNDVFGDPCYGTVKRLYVSATYTISVASNTNTVSSLSFDCSKKGANTVTLSVTDESGNTSVQNATVTVVDNSAPVVTAVANQTFCGTSGSFTIPALTATDNCAVTSVTYAVTGATSRTGTGNNASGTFNAGTSTITWTVKDASNNTTTSSTTVVVGGGPVASISASGTSADFCSELTLSGSSSVSGASYKWVLGSAVVGTSQQYSLGQSSAEGTYQLYVTANGCTSNPASYTFNKQSLLSSYTILVYDNAKFGKYSKVSSGSVGVMGSYNYAYFESNTSVNGPNSFVKAPYIYKVGSGINITKTVNGVASVAVPAMQYNTTNPNSYSNYSTPQYSTVTLSGNYKTLTIRKGTYATLSGTIFGTIDLEEGASVRFTNAVINIDKLLVEDGARDGYYSYVRFAPNSSVRVSTQVSIGSQVLVNPDNYKVTFYVGDKTCSTERFTVKGADTKVIANIIMPNGKLYVTSTDADDDNHGNCGHNSHSSYSCPHRYHNHKACDHRNHNDSDCNDDVYMTGTFIVEDLESRGNTVIWNSFDCGSSSVPVTVINKTSPEAAVTTSTLKSTSETFASSEEDLKITVMPNPSTTVFTLKFESKYETPVNMRVMDANGRVVDAQTKIGSNSTIKIGANYTSGTYYAEMIQGNIRKVIQLIKVRG